MKAKQALQVAKTPDVKRRLAFYTYVYVADQVYPIRVLSAPRVGSAARSDSWRRLNSVARYHPANQK